MSTASPAKPDTKAEEKATTTEATNLDQPTSGTRFVAVARLRRDTMILHSSKDAKEVEDLAAAAVREGRAGEVYIFEALGYFSESEIDFVTAPAATASPYADQNPERVPLLNPSTGEHALDVAAASEASPPTAPTPTQGASGQGDDNRGAGSGTGNEAKLADAKDSVNDRPA